MLEENQLQNIIEAALFAAGKPLTEDQLLNLFAEEEKPSLGTLRKTIIDLQEAYAEKGVELVQVASGYRFQVKLELAPWISKMWEERASRYSRALLETLALIAYRQPITRGEIEDIRGVAVSTSIIKTLLEEREWVRIVGHRDVPGKPALFATTKAFLDYFGLKSLQELPSLPDILNLESQNFEAAEALFDMRPAQLSIPSVLLDEDLETTDAATTENSDQNNLADGDADDVDGEQTESYFIEETVEEITEDDDFSDMLSEEDTDEDEVFEEIEEDEATDDLIEEQEISDIEMLEEEDKIPE